MITRRTDTVPARRLRRARGARWARHLAASALVLLTAGAIAGNARAGVPDRGERRFVIDAALKSTVPPELALAVARVVGRAGFGGGIGVMNLLPDLARREFGVRAGILHNPSANAGLGVALLERLHRRFDGRWDLALSYYRAGPLPRCGDEPVIHEHSLGYVADILEWWRRYQKDESVTKMIEDVRRRGPGRARFTALETGRHRLRGETDATDRRAAPPARGDTGFGKVADVPAGPFRDIVPCCSSTRFF
ncbi:MAG: hypothetical protein OXP07_08455 [Defluviicoccus sp.]|nr:hypothetical protein [Defluviicoccus sp.]